MGNQHVPLTIDENDNVIAVGSINDDTFDVCVMCGKQSPYKRSTHIDHRIGYVEGAGQGCFEPHMCSQERSRTLLTITEELVYSTPNDQELGAKVRQIYWNNKNS